MKKTPVTKWFKPNFVDNVENVQSNDHSKGIPINKKTKPSKGNAKTKKPLLQIQDVSNSNLLEKVSPLNISELAVHNKKVAEVQEWFKSHVVSSNKVSMLLITGPTGSGKTATVKVLCKALNIKLIEWINPVDVDYEEIRGPGQTMKFTEFLLQSSRYPSLLVNNTTQVIVVEDFPNFLVRDPTEFEAILSMLNKKGKYSVVFICAETKDNNSDMTQKLFPDQIKTKYEMTTISFNPISVTLLKQALKRATTIMQENNCNLYQIPSQDTIDTIINSSMGDIRSAINYFNFACLKGSVNLPTTLLNTSGSKRKRKEKDKQTLSHMSRDESLGLLHGVGRVLYPKRIQNPTLKYWQFERPPEKIVDQFVSMPSVFVSFLHENYLRYFGDFTDVNNACEVLSYCETLLADWKDDHVVKYGLWIAIHGLMIHNKHAVSKWNPVQGPKHLKYKYKEEASNGRKIDAIDVGYYNIIKPTGYTPKNQPRFLC